MSDSMLTTTDNPYDPFTQYDEWFAYDMRMGYNTTGYLGRMVVTSNNLSDDDQEVAIEQAIDEIVSENPMYKKVVSTDSTDTDTETM